MRFWLAASTAASAIVAPYAVVQYVRRRVVAPTYALVVVIALLAVAFNGYKAHERHERSAQRAGLALKHHLDGKLGGDERVVAGMMVWDQPELFYYADVDVETMGKTLVGLPDLPDGRWIVLHKDEWAKWSGGAPGRWSAMRGLEPTHNQARVARYSRATDPG